MNELTLAEQRGIAAVRAFDLWYNGLSKRAKRAFWAMPRTAQLEAIKASVPYQKLLG